jgi:signal transduction histidine kinase/heme exporter protein D
MNIYCVPPLLSAIILFTLFLMGILKAKASRANLLFAFICLIGFFLNTDKAILTAAHNPLIALWLSRIDHAFLVFVIPLYLHFAVIVTGYRKWLPLVKACYVVAFLFIPLTQHPLYLTGVKRFFFGFFAMSGPLFYVFGAFSSASVILSICLFVKSLKEERVAIKRTRVKYILLSFGLAATVTHFDIVTMMGHEMYPLGNFAFIPMSLLGYAIFKHDVMEWKIFLNKGMVFLTLFLMSLGFFLGVVVILRHFLGEAFDGDLIYIISMITTFVLIYFSSQKVYSTITQFLQQEFLRNRKALRGLSSEILTLLKISDLKAKVVDGLSRTFGLEKCEIKTVPRIDSNEGAIFLEERDPFWGQGYRLSIPISSKSSPSFLLLGEKQTMSLYTGEETEILMMLANNVALAFDNADAYTKLQDFSLSLEQLVDERTKALIQSESLAAVGRLAAGVAHELNNPLASVMSTLEYQIDHLKENDELRDDLAFSLSELRRARDIVKSLLDASRQREETKELVDIHTPIEDALKVLYNQYKNKKITIIRTFNAENGLIRGNTPRLCQVFINIIKNAIDAIGEKEGYITIETANECLPSQNRGPAGTPGGIVACKVTDDGEGIDKKDLQDIFKPFFTTKSQGKGIGLGLFIVHEIVKDHQGSIQVESDKGSGTIFTLIFPSH